MTDENERALAEIRAFQARLMQGYENSMRQISQHAEMLAQRLTDSEAAAQKRMDAMLALAEQREQLLTQNAEREAMARIAAAREESSRALLRDARALLPIAAKKFLSVPITGDDSHGLQDFLASMDMAQIDELMSQGTLRLSDAQRMALAQVFGSLAAKEEKDNGPT